MNKYLLVLMLLLMTASVHGRDDIAKYSIEALLSTPEAQYVLDPNIQLKFGQQDTGVIVSSYGEIQTNKKTNAFNKSDKEACQWVMLSALKALQQRARKEGMNSVVKISSFYKKRAFISETEFECGAGFLMAGVTLKGTLVKL